MKKRYNLILWSLVLGTVSASAQDSYMNESLTSVTDVIGTSRYMGMGGALGALGADLSVTSSNPAGIGLYRSNDFSITMGLLSQVDHSAPDKDFTNFTFDQAGFVLSMPLWDSKVKFVNWGANVQKKASFNNSMVADNGNTRGLSQTDQLAFLTNNWGMADGAGGFSFPGDLAVTAYDAFLTNQDEQGVFHGQPSQGNQYARVSSGSLMGFDFNLSTNIMDRYYVGATLGIDNLSYSSYSLYTELYEDNQEYFDYNLNNYLSMSGYGVNFKAGFIVRPFAYSAFRLGLAIETPTFYTIERVASMDIDSHYDKDGNYNPNGLTKYYGPDDNYLYYHVVTPWKFRLSMGHTVGDYLAIGAEYEYVNYSATRQSYNDGGYRMQDKEMNRQTQSVFKGGHNAKVGIEFRATDHLYVRAGYNYYSSAYADQARLDQNIDSYTLGYSVSTDFMNTSDVHLMTVGLGYKWKSFYMDMAYKYRAQSADFYAFNDSFIDDGNYIGPDVKLDPVHVNLDRHHISLTLGCKF